SNLSCRAWAPTAAIATLRLPNKAAKNNKILLCFFIVKIHRVQVAVYRLRFVYRLRLRLSAKTLFIGLSAYLAEQN
ncbi:MAG: hypothetical protein CSA44_00735, partial [Gammaproteobacteria bacterium]